MRPDEAPLNRAERQRISRARADPVAAGRSQRDRLFFIVYAGLLIFAFFWATFPHVRNRIADRGLLYGVLTAGLCYVAIRAFLVLSGTGSSRLETLWVSIDLILITALVYLGGGINSDVGLMYILPIFTYSIQRRITGALAVGACSGVLYVLATLPPDPSLDYFGRVATRLVVLILVTLVAACYAIHERARVDEMAALRAGVALGEYRRELSSEIHDGIQHYLVSVAMRLEMARRVLHKDPRRAALIAIDQRLVLRQAADELRYLIRRLRAPSLEHLGFIEALREHVKMFEDRSAIRALLHVEGTPTLLPADAEHGAFRIVQEALTNVEKHAQATEVTVTLAFGETYLDCTITDNGVGFDMDELAGGPGLEGGFGISTMSQRAEQAGGELEVDSAPGRGTTIHFVLPARRGDAPPGGGEAATAAESDPERHVAASSRE